MVDTSLYSKMVRKVKLIHVDLLLHWLENCPWEKTFSLISQNKPSLAETWLIWYNIKSWKRNVTQADQKLSIYGRKSTFLSRRYLISAGLWQVLTVWSMDSCLRSPALSQVYLSITFQLSKTAVVKVEMSSTFLTVPVKLNNSQCKIHGCNESQRS